jgi:hypothetical protein
MAAVGIPGASTAVTMMLFCPVRPNESVAVNVIVWFPAERVFPILLPVPKTPSRFELQVSLVSGMVSSGSKPKPLKLMVWLVA